MANKKLFASIIIVAVIVVFGVFLVRQGPQYYDFMTPPGVGTLNSDHADFALKVILDMQQLDLNPRNNPELVLTNPYIFMGEDGWIHRIATGADLQMFLDSIGLELNDDCLVVTSEFDDVFGEPLRKQEFCEDGDTKLRLYHIGDKKDVDIASYVPQPYDNLVLVFDDIADDYRDFTKYHHKELLYPELFEDADSEDKFDHSLMPDHDMSGDPESHLGH